MDLYGFPSCCTAQVLADFEDADDPGAVVEIDADIQEAIEEATRNTMAIMVAITVSDQEFAEEALERAGFSKTDKIKKPMRHPETELTMWWKVLQDQS